MKSKSSKGSPGKASGGRRQGGSPQKGAKKGRRDPDEVSGWVQ